MLLINIVLMINMLVKSTYNSKCANCGLVGGPCIFSGQTTTEEEAEEVSKGGKKVEHQQWRQQTCYKYLWQEQKSECQRSINNI